MTWNPEPFLAPSRPVDRPTLIMRTGKAQGEDVYVWTAPVIIGEYDDIYDGERALKDVAHITEWVYRDQGIAWQLYLHAPVSGLWMAARSRPDGSFQLIDYILDPPPA